MCSSGIREVLIKHPSPKFRAQNSEQTNFDLNAKGQCRRSREPAKVGERGKNGGVFASNAERQLGKASEALKQPNFDLSDGANGAQLDWQPDGAWIELSIERLWDSWVHAHQM